MGVGIRVGDHYREVGAASFFNAFFSTIAVQLEPSGWGTRFPLIMQKLFSGRLPPADAAAARTELETIFFELGRLPPSSIVWDHNDRSRQPPWGTDIDPRITSMANYFVTSDGRDLFEALFASLNVAIRDVEELIIQ